MECANNTFRDSTVRINSNIEALCRKNAGNAFQYYSFSQGDMRISGDNPLIFEGLNGAKVTITIPSSFCTYDCSSEWNAQIVVYGDQVFLTIRVSASLGFSGTSLGFSGTNLTK